VSSKCEDAAGFILAGGMSSRMGRDKALVLLAGRPLIEHGLDILGEAGLSASIAGARSELSNFAPTVADEMPDAGPLSGVCAALAPSTARWVVFLSVDQPLMPAKMITYLLRHARIADAAVTLAAVNGFPQTFPAVIDRAALPALSAELETGRSGCYAAFRAAATALGQPLSILPVELLAQSGQVDHPRALPPALWFLNVNTPADLARGEVVLSRGIA